MLDISSVLVCVHSNNVCSVVRVCVRVCVCVCAHIQGLSMENAKIATTRAVEGEYLF